jgi:polyhydroxyalkanoate synthesis repressor PhaR
MIVIKKYSNRRLYDTSSSAYVNLQQIADRIREGHRIKVVDAKEGDDLTQQILLQILLELQGTKEMLPNGLLHRMIRSTTDHPVQRLAMTQMATGLQLLDQQLAAFEGQAGWAKAPTPTAKAPTEAKPPPEPDAPPEEKPPPASKKRARARPTPAQSESPAAAADGELDDLRARLAALEQRLTGDR